MSKRRLHAISAVVGRYGALYPAAAATGAYATSTTVAASFGTVLFYVFAGAAILTGFGAASSGPSIAADSAGDVFALFDDPTVSDPDHDAGGGRWSDTFLVKCGLFTLGLGVVLTGLTVGIPWTG